MFSFWFLFQLSCVGICPEAKKNIFHNEPFQTKCFYVGTEFPTAGTESSNVPHKHNIIMKPFKSESSLWRRLDQSEAELSFLVSDWWRRRAEWRWRGRVAGGWYVRACLSTSRTLVQLAEHGRYQVWTYVEACLPGTASPACPALNNIIHLVLNKTGA